MSRKGIVLWLALTMLCSFMVIVIEVAPNVTAYTPHDPIHIDGDVDFASQAVSEGWPGDGTEGNPYIIEGYDINTSYATGINIISTTVHFIIKDILIGGYLYINHGIYLDDVTNCIIKNCTIRNLWGFGIYLNSSYGISIVNSTISNTTYGMYFAYSYGILVSGNNVSWNYGGGIYLYYPREINFNGNIMLNDGISIYGNLLEHWDSHDIDSSNTVNSKPIYYVRNQTGGFVPSGAGQVILVNCTGMYIENQELNDATTGIELGFSSECNIINNTLNYNNGNGIYLYQSNRNNISSNYASHNREAGFYLEYSKWNNITDNIAYSNRGEGIYLDFSSENNISGNNISDNVMWSPRKGIYLQNANNNKLKDNNLSHLWYGIHSSYSNENTLINNNIINGYQGIYLDYSNQNHIINNNVSNINQSCIKFISSMANYIKGNNISISLLGINIDSSDGNNIVDNRVYSNDNGIFLYNSSTNNISKNNVLSNYYEGIGLLASSDNKIRANNASDSKYGISIMGESNENIITANNASYNSIGIYLSRSKWNTISNNIMIKDGIYLGGQIIYGYYHGSPLDHWNTHTIDTSNTVNGKPIYYWKNMNGGTIPSDAGQVILANCTKIQIENLDVTYGSFGIILGFSSENNIEFNNVSNNSLQGIHLYKSNDNNIYGNSAFNNGGEGIYLLESDNSKIIGNIAINNKERGIFVRDSDGIDLIGNNVSNNEYGICLFYVEQSNIEGNLISNNQYGLELYCAYYNTFDHNNILNNLFQINQSYFSNNIWDDGSGVGNYWSDYKGVDNDGDGVGDTDLPHQGVDNCPLVEPVDLADYGKTIPDNGGSIFSEPWILASIVMLIILLFVILFYIIRKKRGNKITSEINAQGIHKEQQQE